MSIVVATDLTDATAPLLRLAAALGRGGAVHLVHVVPEGVAEDTLADRRRRLTAEAETLRGLGVGVSEALHQGDAAPTILSMAWTFDAELIVLGGGAGHRRLGSVARAVAQGSPVPLLVARGAPDDLPEHLKVFVGVDFSPASAAAVAWARGIPGAQLHVAHVWDAMALRARLGLQSPIDPDAPAAEVLAGLERDCLAIAGAGDVTVHTAAIRHGETEADALVGLATRHGAHVLVLGTHARRFAGRLNPGGMLDEALRHGPLPIVTVPDRVARHRLPSMRRVVVALDFSEASEDAVAYAFTLAGARGVVHLVHVREPSYEAFDVERERDLGLRDRLMALVPDAGREQGTAILASVLASPSPAKALVAEAERLAVDAIVVGGRPHSAIYNAVVGSFVHELLGATLRPVLVVRPREQA